MSPIVLVASAEYVAAHGEHGVGSGDGLAHPGLLHPRADHDFAGRVAGGMRAHCD